MSDAPIQPLRFILDTNVVIDWLVFDDPYMNPLREQVRSGAIVVLTHDLAIEEFERVLQYPALQRLSQERRADALEQYRMQTQSAVMPPGFGGGVWQLPSNFPRCQDPDDQLFLGLAYHTRATALVSRDDMLLKMRKRVRKFEVRILDVQQLIALLNETTAGH